MIDLLLLEHDDTLPFFIGIAMIISRKDLFLATKPEDVPTIIDQIRIESRDDVLKIFQHARTLCNEFTPISAKNQLNALIHPTNGMLVFSGHVVEL